MDLLVRNAVLPERQKPTAIAVENGRIEAIGADTTVIDDAPIAIDADGGLGVVSYCAERESPVLPRGGGPLASLTSARRFAASGMRMPTRELTSHD